jgi:pyruvate dehydrogenase E1 component
MAAEAPTATPPADLEVLDSIQRRVLWLAVWTVHHANKLRRSQDRIKVGGHQASSASAVGILTSLYFDFLRAGDMVAVKPHASPAFHACQYLMGRLDRRYLTRFRAADGLQAYPSRTKDPDHVDFSTGSVGLGSVAPNYAALIERYLSAHFGTVVAGRRFVSVLGDAELDEGTVWETVAEPALDGLDNLIWVVDLNRQSLDRIVPGVRVARLREMFRANGWEVIDAKYGRLLEAVFEQPGGELLRRRIDEASNEQYQWLLRAAPDQRREWLGRSHRGLRATLADRSDHDLYRLVSDLGGHDLGVLRASLAQGSEAGRPAVIFAYTIKGWGLPIAGDALNHSALLDHDQIAELRGQLGLQAGQELDRFPAGSPEDRLCRLAAERLGDLSPPDPSPGLRSPSDLDSRYPRSASSQQAFSLALAELGRKAPELAGRVVTTSPDVSISTSLGGWINRRGVFSLSTQADRFSESGPRVLKWERSPLGQHIELGISENNLFMLLGQMGLSAELFSQPLVPIGTLYDPFICRGLDALVYGLYSGARFIVVATPSGVTLSPEGGAHQSVITPSIGLELPRLTYWEPCFAEETEWALLESVRMLGGQDGGCSYLRLSTKPVDHSPFLIELDRRGREPLRGQVLSGAYLLVDRTRTAGYVPTRNAVTVAASGVMVPEALRAGEILTEDGVYVNVVNITSPGRLYQDYQRTMRNLAERGKSGLGAGERWRHPAFPEGTPLITVLDGHPHTLAWLQSALGRDGLPLGVTDFGRSGTTADLYASFGIDVESIMGACIATLSHL